MTATIAPSATCGAHTTTQGGHVYVCRAKPHPETPGKHYFSLDTEATVNAAPTNSHLESAIEAFFRREVRKLGGHAIKMVPTSKGLPDRLVVMPGGRTYFVELKQTSGKTSPAQDMWHSRLRGLGHHVAVLYGRDDCKQWLRLITEQAGPQFRKTSEPRHD